MYLGLTKTGARNPHAGAATLHDPAFVAHLRAWKSIVSSAAYLIPAGASCFCQAFPMVSNHIRLGEEELPTYGLRPTTIAMWLTWDAGHRNAL